MYMYVHGMILESEMHIANTHTLHVHVPDNLEHKILHITSLKLEIVHVSIITYSML